MKKFQGSTLVCLTGNSKDSEDSKGSDMQINQEWARNILKCLIRAIVSYIQVVELWIVDQGLSNQEDLCECGLISTKGWINNGLTMDF